MATEDLATTQQDDKNKSLEKKLSPWVTKAGAKGAKPLKTGSALDRIKQIRLSSKKKIWKRTCAIIWS